VPSKIGKYHEKQPFRRLRPARQKRVLIEIESCLHDVHTQRDIGGPKLEQIKNKIKTWHERPSAHDPADPAAAALST